MIIEKKTLRIYFGMFIICLLSFTTGLHNVLFGGLSNAIYILLFGILLIWNRETNFLNDRMSLFVLLLVGIMLFNNQDNKRLGSFFVYGSLVYILAWSFFILNKKNNSWHEPFFKLCLAFGMLHSISTWFFKFVPDFYTSNIIPILGAWSGTALREFQNGWAPGISPSYSTNAVYLALGFCAAVSLLISEGKKKHFIPVIICISALLLTGKRSQLLVSVFSFLLMYYLYNSDRKATRVFKLCGIAIVSILVFDIASQFVPELANFINRFYQTAEMGDVSLGRTTRFLESIQVFLKHPLLGIGWNGSSYYFAQTTENFINVHNIYIQLLCETGIIGFTVYVTFYVYNFVVAFKMIKKVKNVNLNRNQKAIICNAFMVEVFFLLYGMTGNPLYDFQTLFPYVASCAIILYYSKNTTIITMGGENS